MSKYSVRGHVVLGDYAHVIFEGDRVQIDTPTTADCYDLNQDMTWVRRLCEEMEDHGVPSEIEEKIETTVITDEGQEIKTSVETMEDLAFNLMMEMAVVNPWKICERFGEYIDQFIDDDYLYDSIFPATSDQIKDLCRHQLTMDRMEDFDRYIDEAEHGDGHQYWQNFANVEEAIADFKMYQDYEDQNPRF